MPNQLTKLLVQLGLKDGDLKKGLAGSERSLKGFGQAVGRIGGLIAGAFSVAKIIQFSKEAHNLNAELQGVKRGFDNIATPGLLNELQRATKGTVTNLELMKAAVRANNFKIPLQEMGKLLSFAHARAIETGESVDYLVNSIVTGIGRKSPLILDNLGISAVELREKLKGVGIEAASVADITKIIGDIAETELGKMAKSAELTAKEVNEKLAASWKNWLTYMGGTGIPIINKVKNALANLFTSSSVDTGQVAIEEFEALKKTFSQSLGNKSFDEATKAIREAKMATDELLANYILVSGASDAEIKTNLAKIKGAKEYIKWLTEGLQTNEQIQKVIDENSKKTDKLQQNEIITITKLKEQLDELNKSKGSADISDKKSIANINKEINALERQIQVLEDLGKIKLKKAPTFEDIPFSDESVIDEIDSNIQNFEDSITNSMLTAQNEIDKTNEAFDKLAEKTKNTEDTFINSFMSAEKGVEGLKKSVINAAREEILALTAKAIAGVIANALVSLGPLGLIVGAGLGAAAGSLMNSAIPSFANEGQADRKMLAWVGDYPGAKSNPEFMIKKSTLEKMGGNTQVEIYPSLINGDIILESVIRSNNKRINRGRTGLG